jgi:hypothetical protein
MHNRTPLCRRSSRGSPPSGQSLCVQDWPIKVGAQGETALYPEGHDVELGLAGGANQTVFSVHMVPYGVTWRHPKKAPVRGHGESDHVSGPASALQPAFQSALFVSATSESLALPTQTKSVQLPVPTAQLPCTTTCAAPSGWQRPAFASPESTEPASEIEPGELLDDEQPAMPLSTRQMRRFQVRRTSLP